MAHVIRATWTDLERLVTQARKTLLLCTPYYSGEGIARVFDALSDSLESLAIATRLSPSDWVLRVSDPEELAIFLELVTEGGYETSLSIHQRLHAKAYLVDDKLGLVGSANLSASGFGANFELMVELREADAREAAALIRTELGVRARRLDIAALRAWVDQHRPTIAELRKREAAQVEELAEVQRDLDGLLGFGRGGGGGSRAEAPDMPDFVRWLESNRSLPGSEVLLDRHYNTSGQNLTGHFKQSYRAVSNFLVERPDLIGALSSELNELDPDDIFAPDTDILDPWNQHLDDNATRQGDDYDYAVLRAILPPYLGGTVQGGGGGSSTLKRMFPLVGRFLVELGVS